MPLTFQQFQALRAKGLSPQQIASFEAGNKPQTIQPATNKQKTGFGSKIGDTLGGIANAVIHPIDTAKNIASTLFHEIMPNPAGGGENDVYTPAERKQLEVTNAVSQAFTQKYGSVENLKNYAYTDPVGFAMDASMLLGGAGTALKSAGETSNLSKVARAGEITSKAASAINPIEQSLRGLGKVAGMTKGKTIAPFASSYNTEMADLAKANGIQLPASSLSSSKAVPIMESIGAKGFFGKNLANMVDTAGAKIGEMADNLVASIGKSSDLKAVGDAISNGANNFRNVWMKTKNTLYDNASLKGSSIRVVPEKTLAYLKDIVESKKSSAKVLGGSSDLKFFQKIQNNLSKGANAENLKNALSDLNQKVNWKSTDPIVTGNQAILKKLGALMSDDLDNAIKEARPDLAASIDKANQYYKNGLSKLNSSWGKQIKRNASQPEKLYQAVISKATPNDIPTIFQTLGTKASDSIRNVFANQIMEKSKLSGGQISPAKLNNILSSNEDMIRAVLGDDHLTSLKNIAKLSEALKSGQKIAEGSQTAFITKIGGELGLLFTNPWLGLKAILGDAAYSKFIASPAGQDFLTKGWKLSGKTGDIIKGSAKSLGNNVKYIYQASKANQ